MKSKNILPGILLIFVLSLGIVSFTMAEEGNEPAAAYEEENYLNNEDETLLNQLTETPVIIIEEPKAQYDIYDVIVVTITAEEGFDIYYTLDGSNPLTEGLLYEDSFEIPAPEKDTAITLRAIAVKQRREETEISPSEALEETIESEENEEEFENPDIEDNNEEDEERIVSDDEDMDEHVEEKPQEPEEGSDEEENSLMEDIEEDDAEAQWLLAKAVL